MEIAEKNGFENAFFLTVTEDLRSHLVLFQNYYNIFSQTTQKY